jgi:hypothetical protein
MKGELEVERGIAIPPMRRGFRRRSIHYPFVALEIGESFLVPRGADQRVVASMCLYWKKKIGRVFTTRTVDGGIRVWRIE